MTSRDFCYWLQGFFELANPEAELSIEQKHIIKNHLAMVFRHEIDPSFGGKEKQEQLRKDHSGQGQTGHGQATSSFDLVKALADGTAKLNC